MKLDKFDKQAILIAIAVLVSIAVLIPILWAISTSLKPDDELFLSPPRILPTHIQWSNYIEGWKLIPFAQYFINSFYVSVPTAILSVLLCSMAAFAFTRIPYSGKNIIFILYLSMLMVPQVVRLIPSFIIIRNVKLINSYIGQIIPQVAWMIPFGTFMIMQFFEGIPISLDECAKIDGAGYLRVFTRILLPNVVPAMLTLGIYSFLSSWNNLIWSMIVVNKEARRTITLGLATLTGPSVDFVPPWNLVMAATIISILPILTLYLAFQKYFIRSVALSGIKG